MSALFGLIIALGSYALLNTINPGLLNTSANISAVSATTDQEYAPWSEYQEGDNLTACPGGFKNVSVPGATPDLINICGSISTKLASMINEAKRAGITLSGYGSRSTASQIQKRINNCGGTANIYKDKAKCNPKTALPGSSNHEKGLAIDFNCNGQTMEAAGGINSVCYKWLSANASKYDFYNNYNLLKESWHWSTTGT